MLNQLKKTFIFIKIFVFIFINEWINIFILVLVVYLFIYLLLLIFILQICLVHAMLSDASCIVGEFHIYFNCMCVVTGS